MRNRQAGFNMLEILFSLLIVTTGLLGLAATQVIAQRAEQESYQRAQAIVLMTDIVDRINTNRKAAICYNISDPTTGAGYLGATGSGKYNISSYACPALATNPAAGPHPARRPPRPARYAVHRRDAARFGRETRRQSSRRHARGAHLHRLRH